MNSLWYQLRAFFYGPRLYSIADMSTPYVPNILESLGSSLFGLSEALKTFCIASSPLLLPYVLIRYDLSTIIGMTKWALIVYSTALFLRAAGRFANYEYRKFALLQCEVFATSPSRLTADLKRQLKRYDYEIAVLPVADFNARLRPTKWFPPIADEDGHDKIAEPLATMREALAYWAANSFGRRMLFPGSLAILKALIRSTLAESRRKIISSKIGERNVLKTEDEMLIDTMFWDRRSKTANGNTLIICFEGNAGFYEVGIAITPNSLDYSVLGWNMPGFGESGGEPLPYRIINAADAVMQFAIDRLGFAPENIVLYAWSIGGYPATWVAANYPDVRALILDASFDDLVPLAINRMPSFMSSIVQYSVRKYLNLPNALQLRNYSGPVRLIRRWNDEIIISDELNLDDHGRRATNRANNLLIDFLTHRYPGLLRSEREMELVKTWLALDAPSRVMMFNSEEPSLANAKMLVALQMTEDKREKYIKGMESLDSVQLSILIQQLCHKHFVDFDASHNTPLNALFFNIPTPLIDTSKANKSFPGQGYVLGRKSTEEDKTQSTSERRNSRDSIMTLSSMGSSTDSEIK